MEGFTRAVADIKNMFLETERLAMDGRIVDAKGGISMLQTHKDGILKLRDQTSYL